MKKYLFAFVTSFYCLLLAAQDGWVVYSTQGAVVVIADKKKSSLTTGTLIPADGIVMVPLKGAVTFICKEGAMFSITRPGKYALAKYPDSCYASTDMLLTSYASYIWNQVARPYRYHVKTRRDFFPHYRRAVSRFMLNIWIDNMLDTINYPGNKGSFPISWKSYDDVASFQFALYDSGNTSRPFESRMLSALKIPIRDFSAKLKPGKTYYWSVALKDEEPDQLMVFNYVSKTVYDSILSVFNRLQPRFEAPAEKAFRLGFMLEQAYYFEEAWGYYLKAVQLAPANTLYRSTLEAFKKEYEIK